MTSLPEDEQQHSAEAVMRLLEASAQVHRRHQFFGWVQGHLNDLLPQAVLVCGVYQRSRRGLQFDLFNSVVLAPGLVSELCDERSDLLRGAVDAWVAQQGRAVALDAASMACAADRRQALVDAGLATLLAHGVARPQRPAEVESFFVFGKPGYRVRPRDLNSLELLLPCLHATYLRVQATELDLSQRNGAQRAAPPPPVKSQPLTDRERQILLGVREGKSNAEIGQALGISALTVKNHVQNILRKLGAANRAQAVAKAGAFSAGGTLGSPDPALPKSALLRPPLPCTE